MRVLVTAFKACMMAYLAVVVVCVVTNVVHSTTIWIEKSSINVTRDEYNRALSKWQARRATEYEMIVEYTGNGGGSNSWLSGRWRLHLSNGKVDILDHPDWGRQTPIGATATKDEIQILTFDGLFGEVDKWLADNALQLNGRPQDYFVEFNSNWGYPAQISRSERPHEVSGGIAYDYGFQSRMKVTVVSFHAIKSK